MPLSSFYQQELIEAGCDEAGRGWLAGPVYAAAVILPKNFYHPLLTDSKQLTEKQRFLLRACIEKEAVSYSLGIVSHTHIDQINILQASILAMHRAIGKLQVQPELLLIDGNRFNQYQGISHVCIVKGDSLYFSIAAASILAKTYRDEYMLEQHSLYPEYNWISNKGYPTACHRNAIEKYGVCHHHRMTFRLPGIDKTKTAAADAV